MNRLLDPVRAILADLVRKRLWPIAAALVIALVAIPLLIAASSSSPQTRAPDGAVAVAAAVPEPVPATGAAAAGREGTGRVRDPFFDPPAAAPEGKAAGQPPETKRGDPPAKRAAPPAKRAAEAGAKRAAGPGAKRARRTPAAVPAAPADAKAGSPRKKTPSRPPVQRSAPAPATYYRTAAAVGAGTETRPLTRLTPIGGRRDPAAIYLGVMKAGRPYAVFALGRRTTSAGDAACASGTSCRLIGLRPGETQTITRHSADGRNASHFVVQVRAVTRSETTAAKARAARARVHPDGPSATRAMSRSRVVAETLGRIGYRRSSGLLYSILAADALAKAAR